MRPIDIKIGRYYFPLLEKLKQKNRGQMSDCRGLRNIGKLRKFRQWV